MHRIDTAERRRRLVVRHALAPRLDDPAAVARALVALHSTDPATVYLSVWARTASVDPQRVERALYEERELVRMLGMRRTLFVVPRELVGVVHAACTRTVAQRERRRFAGFVAASEVSDDPEGWIESASAAALAALAARGQAFSAELADDVPELGAKLRLGAGTKYELEQRAASRVLYQLAAEGRVVRGRPRGTWISSQYGWAPTERWLGAPVEEPDTETAQAELLRRWLHAFGPATETDVRWWTGWTAREARAALAAVAHVAVDLDGAAGLALAEDLEPTPEPEPRAALLPALDPTTMGWKERGWYLGTHGPTLFDRNGNAGPTVWWGGRVVGGWAQRRDGEVAVRLLEDVGADATNAVGAEAARLEAWLGDVRFTPRFPTPLQRELVS